MSVDVTRGGRGRRLAVDGRGPLGVRGAGCGASDVGASGRRLLPAPGRLGAFPAREVHSEVRERSPGWPPHRSFTLTPPITLALPVFPRDFLSFIYYF